MSTPADPATWGRVDDDGNVYVRQGDDERLVGQYPGATPEEALGYYERKFADLAGQVSLLEQRSRAGAPATDVAKAVRRLEQSVRTANAVGDLQGLLDRLGALSGTVAVLTEKQSAEAKADIERALTEREALVVEAERIAAQDPASTQWKQATATMEELFARWQTAQQDGPRLPKDQADALWKRFRAARTTVDQHRRAFFAELDAAQRDVRRRKQELVDRAEALASQGAQGIPAYRDLLEQWKAAGRAGKKQDDALWARFKAAGDLLYGAKAEVDALEDVEFSANLTAKQTLLGEAEPLLKEKDPKAARERLTAIQRRWDEIGKVPRDHVKTINDGIRRIETAVKALEDEYWRRNNPETKARSEGLAAQLHAAIEKLENELESAKKTGDARKVKDAEEALAARKVWLDALGS
ncbi:MAG: ATPase [Naasia sp.]|nr:ATPase [Naasia sp.]